MEDFIINYLGGITVEVKGLQKDTKDLSPKQKLDIVIDIATKISNDILTSFGDYRGTKSFYREPLRKYFTDKKIFISVRQQGTSEIGKSTMRYDINDDFKVDLDNSDWFVYKDHYGTSEEKYFVKFINDELSKLQENYKDIYLLRNERFFKIYNFSDGKSNSTRLRFIYE